MWTPRPPRVYERRNGGDEHQRQRIVQCLPQGPLLSKCRRHSLPALPLGLPRCAARQRGLHALLGGLDVQGWGDGVRALHAWEVRPRRGRDHALPRVRHRPVRKLLGRNQVRALQEGLGYDRLRQHSMPGLPNPRRVRRGHHRLLHAVHEGHPAKQGPHVL